MRNWGWGGLKGAKTSILRQKRQIFAMRRVSCTTALGLGAVAPQKVVQPGKARLVPELLDDALQGAGGLLVRFLAAAQLAELEFEERAQADGGRRVAGDDVDGLLDLAEAEMQGLEGLDDLGLAQFPVVKKPEAGERARRL